MTTLSPLDELIQTTRNDIKYTLQRIKERAESMARQMKSLASQVDTLIAGVPTISINSLGEIQGGGSSMDVLCAQLAARREALERLVWLKDQK